ncbi:hypothetical protein [Neorhodopirellula pilleata]|uniref:hypothetical protein n=1 Tax=Neorhodopirellula pilleata TaxID=2714738 RepID=UPI0011B5CD75|nr:hypothetical protein [Neorhodopirellula pilleata]
MTRTSSTRPTAPVHPPGQIERLPLMQVDAKGARLLFEGKKERWCIPADSIGSIRLEEVQVGTPGESATSTLLYFVLISFASPMGEFEYGLRDDSRDFGAFDDIKRAKAGKRLYETIRAILPEPANSYPPQTVQTLSSE